MELVRFTELKVLVKPKTGYVNLTKKVVEAVRKSGVRSGQVTVQTLHTTTALLLQEDEPGFIRDLQKRIARIFPQHYKRRGKRRLEYYEHDDLKKRKNPQPDERRNGFAHCRVSLLSASVMLIVNRGRPVLGEWQQVLFFDCDPKGRPPRRLRLMVMGMP